MASLEISLPVLIGLLACGFALGALVAALLLRGRRRQAQEIAQELLAQSESQRVGEIEALLRQMKESFAALSLEALTKSMDAFLKMASETVSAQTAMGQRELDVKKQMIDRTLEAMKEELGRVEALLQEFEKDREQKFGKLAEQMRMTLEATGKLQETTQHLREALSSTKVRGQWGERMAEDVLRVAGFVEGINYEKQKTLESSQGRPDFTFFLPQGHVVHMDVKFPFDNYLRYLEARSEAEKGAFKDHFFRDVRARVKELAARAYTAPEERSLEYVILFIPNEQVWSFIHEHDRSVLEDALKQKVIMCSPVTLYAVLAVIRKAVEHFNLEKTASRILSLLGTFSAQWRQFTASMDKLGRRIEDAQREFFQLSSTRRNQLEKPLAEIEALRMHQEGIEGEAGAFDDESEGRPKN